MALTARRPLPGTSHHGWAPHWGLERMGNVKGTGAEAQRPEEAVATLCSQVFRPLSCAG